jgi:repressor of nif and glnA expression
VQKLLEDKGFNITDQQLRLRLQILNELDLVIIRQGRAGTTISSKGEKFLEKVMK